MGWSFCVYLISACRDISALIDQVYRTRAYELPFVAMPFKFVVIYKDPMLGPHTVLGESYERRGDKWVFDCSKTADSPGELSIPFDIVLTIEAPPTYRPSTV